MSDDVVSVLLSLTPEQLIFLRKIAQDSRLSIDRLYDETEQTPMEDTRKPHHGRIVNWAEVGGSHIYRRVGRSVRIYGRFLDREGFTDGFTTALVSHDTVTGEIETKNSRYTLLKDTMNIPERRVQNFPFKGDLVRFLGENGTEAERKAACDILKTGECYTVTHCEVGDWCSYLWLDGFGRRGYHGSLSFNTVMFEIVKRVF